jgi:hypothetical protein
VLLATAARDATLPRSRVPRTRLDCKTVRPTWYAWHVDERELEIREVAHDVGDGERIQESAAEVATVALGAGSFALAGIQAYYARAAYRLQREEAQDELAALRHEIHEELRHLRYEMGGLDALDEYDGFSVEES